MRIRALIFSLSLAAFGLAGGAAHALSPSEISVGLRGYGMLPFTVPNTSTSVGAAFEIPVVLHFPNAWGLRLGVHGTWHRENLTSMAWWAPLRSDSDGDGIWEPGERSDPDLGGRRLLHLRPSTTLSFGFLLALHRSLKTRLDWLHPYLGGGLVFGAVYQTFRLDPKSEGYLLRNESRSVGGPKPFSLQLLPGISLYGGLGFLVGKGVLLNLELGGGFLPVPTANVNNIREDYQVGRGPFDLIHLRVGGGVDYRF